MCHFLVKLRVIAEHETAFSFIVTAASAEGAMRKALILEFYEKVGGESTEECFTHWVDGGYTLSPKTMAYAIKAEEAKPIKESDIETLRQYFHIHS